MKIRVMNPGLSAAIGFMLVVALIALWAWVWLGIFGFSLLQTIADVMLVFGSFLVAVGIGPPIIKKANI